MALNVKYEDSTNCATEKPPKKDIQASVLMYSSFMLFFLWSLFKGQSAVLPWEGKTVMVLGKKQ